MECFVEIIASLAFSALAWLIWQLIKAKKFNRFKEKIDEELKDKVVTAIIDELNETRSDMFPNNECHQAATIFYWTQYKSRILQAALNKEIIDEQWLKDTGNLRNSQHLFFIEQDKMAR